MPALSTPYGSVTLVFRSALAGRMAGSWGAFTPNDHTILVANDRIDRDTLAEEIGHTLEAKKRGILYLPWVIVGYIRKGYLGSKAETEAHLWAQEHGRELPLMVYEDGTVRWV